MKQFFIVILLVITYSYSFSQPKNKGDVIFDVAEEMPYFKGGEVALTNYLDQNLNYPEQAKIEKVKGKVYVSFIVDKEGNIKNVQTIKKIGGGCDEEAIRVVKAMPKWVPGRQKGRIVNVNVHLPIKFEYKETKEKGYKKPKKKDTGTYY